ncbi:MAG: hypothetical protein JKY49_14825 [Cohaesibacteraceae bacterium]|nr:hypothetical protein [Cohaesibacteraceae bacterium]
MSEDKKDTNSKTQKQSAREKRLVDALRSNLKRRKAQSRARSDTVKKQDKAEPGESS